MLHSPSNPRSSTEDARAGRVLTCCACVLWTRHLVCILIGIGVQVRVPRTFLQTTGDWFAQQTGRAVSR